MTGVVQGAPSCRGDIRYEVGAESPGWCAQARAGATPQAQSLAAKLLRMHAENAEAAGLRPEVTVGAPAKPPPPHSIVQHLVLSQKHEAYWCGQPSSIPTLAHVDRLDILSWTVCCALW